MGLRGSFRIGLRVGLSCRMPAGDSGTASDAGDDTLSAPFKPPITAEVFSVFAPKSICRNRRIVVSLSPTTLTRYT